MTEKKKFIHSSLWWLDVSILNNSTINFKYKLKSNLFFLNLLKNFYFFYFLINKKNLNSLLFLNLDATFVNRGELSNYYLSTQTIFSDFKILVSIVLPKSTYIYSLSPIYSGNTWVERELKEFYKLSFINLTDSRKLLSNYNYNNNLNYNQFNNIIQDISI